MKQIVLQPLEKKEPKIKMRSSNKRKNLNRNNRNPSFYSNIDTKFVKGKEMAVIGFKMGVLSVFSKDEDPLLYSVYNGKFR